VFVWAKSFRKNSQLATASKVLLMALVVVNGMALVQENPYSNRPEVKAAQGRKLVIEGRKNYQDFLLQIDKPGFAETIESSVDNSYPYDSLPVNSGESWGSLQFKGKADLQICVFPVQPNYYDSDFRAALKRHHISESHIFWSSY